MKVVIKEYGNKSEARLLRSFSSKKAARAWIMEGMFSCEGAERDHYVNMLEQLESGEVVLYYDDNPADVVNCEQFYVDLDEAVSVCGAHKEIVEFMKKKGWNYV